MPISGELRASLADYVADLRASPWADAWRWTDPVGWHITLAFLGSISPSTIPDIAARLSEVAARHTAFTVRTGELGAFPSMRRPRVLWVGVDDGTGKLADLANEVRASLGREPDESFLGHVTIARRSRRATPHFVVSDAAEAPIQTLRVREVSLVRTHLAGGAPRYRILRTFAF